MKLRQKFNKLIAAKSKMNESMAELTSELTEYIDFDFAITEVGGDGFCVLNEVTTNIAPLSICIREIKNTGKLTEANHKKLSI